MGLFSGLVKIGGRLGMIRIVSTTAPASARKIPMRKVSLKDLAAEVRQQEVQALAQGPQELSVEFAQVFEAAGIRAPAHGWTIERLAQVLQDPALRGLDRKSVQKEILRRLAADQAHVHEVIQDAVARDRALDAFEQLARRKMEDRQAVRQHSLAEIQEQIQDLQRQCDRLSKDSQADQAQWKQWRDRKMACEKEMALAVSFLVENQVITVDPGG